MSISRHQKNPIEKGEHASWTVVITARAKYLKPWYEGFAQAQYPPWQTLLVCPAEAPHQHPPETTTPQHPNLKVQEIRGRRHKREAGGKVHSKHYFEQYTWLPASNMAEVLRANNTRGLIVHEYSPFCLAALLFGRRNGLPIVSFTDVGRGNADQYSFKTRLWHRFWSQFVHGIMAGCPASRTPLSGRSLPYVEAYHAVDSTEFQPLSLQRPSDAPTTFVYSGQWIHRKGLDLWLAAAKRLITLGHTQFRLRFVGGGDEAWLRQLAANLDLLDYIEWEGYLQGEAMRQAIGTGDVFVLPSRSDSYAVVAHEAACLGLPLLISRHAGVAAAMIQDGITGWSFTPEDTEDFAHKMARMLDTATRLEMGKNARSLAEQLSSPNRGKAVWNWIQQNFL